MAKKIYVVALANGTEVEVTSKKAVRELEGIVSVTVDGADITADFVEAPNEYVEAVEAIEAVEEAQAEVEAIEGGPEQYLYVKAARDGSKLFWDVIDVEGFQMGMTFKEIEALLPEPLHAEARNVIFVSIARIRAYLDEGKQYGIRTTNKDFTKNYNRIMGVELPVSECVGAAYADILVQLEAGSAAGAWDAPEIEAPEDGGEPEVDAAA